MPRGGSRPGAGRPRRSKPAAATTPPAAAEPAAKLEQTPLEYVLAVMNDPAVDADRRDKMALAALGFVHAKGAQPGKKQQQQEAAERATTNRFAPPAPPKLVVDNQA
jgi:phage terminase small subunit